MSSPQNPHNQVLRAAAAAAVFARATLRPERPDRLMRAAVAMAWTGPTVAGAVAAATARYPLAAAVVDERGSLSFAKLWIVSDAVARALHDCGIGKSSTVGVLHRNDRDFVIAMIAATKLGASIVYLNTGFAGPQLADVASREGVDAITYDDEFAEVVATSGVSKGLSGSEIAEVGARRSMLPLLPSRSSGRSVILTSGTTGRPKGANRDISSSGDALTPLLATIPLRARDTVVIAAPLFHAWGLVHLGVGLGMSSTAVVQPTFDAESTLAAVAAHRAAGLVVVPVMLQRILALGGEIIARYDTSSLRYIACSGSALGASLATAAINRFGPVLYNVYGSTEVSLATVAGPADLQAEPSTVGRPAPGSTVKIFDVDGEEVPTGHVGRVFVGNSTHFDGYTGGGGKEAIDGLLSSGDMGHFDAAGLLFIDGRDDDMIVSGGENVFPAEVEDLLGAYPGVAEAAVIGVDDEQFGKRLKAFIVASPGQTLTAAELKAHVRDHLARYKVPGAIEFVDSLPRTTTGKLRRMDLK